jgi:cell division protein FtsI (penicillin-binding protein 3)
MRFWRAPKRPRVPSQPSLPGLFTIPTEKPSFHRLATAGERSLDLARSRLAFVCIMFGLVFLVISGRLTSLALFSDPPDLVSATLSPSDATITSRADVTDRNGSILATSLPTVSVCANARKMLEPDSAMTKLASVLLDIDAPKLTAEIHGSKRCVMIERHLTPRQYYAINKLGIVGLEFTPDEHRIYPTGNLMSHVVGFADIDNKGLAGVEKSLDSRLSQEPAPVALSLDLRLQMILRRELQNAVEDYRAEASSGIVMDVNTGEILAMASLPDFDPHRAGLASPDSKFNRVTLGVYEMGSVFKIFNAALALESGQIKPGDIFDTTHPIEIGHQTIHDFHPEPHNLNVVEILTHSSNLGAARMAERVGGLKQRAFLGRLGLMEKADIELPEIGAPLVPSPSNWGEATTLTVSYGHGIAVNEVQMAAAVSSLVNGGFKVKPTLLKVANPHQGDRIVSAKTSQQLLAMMRLVVTHGTAKKAEVPGYLIAGKTGTADKVSGKKYAENSRRASFIGVFPANAPRYLVFVMLDDPKGNTKTYGFANAGWNAAPTVGHIVSQIGPLLGAQPLEPEMAEVAEQQTLRSLGPDVLARFQIGTGEDYASNETDSEDQ